ncbi:hypothetical protein [Methylicorpusculum sp.]|uniref:hypothetical protein n=1 Tax=Methylicorpusculum sp. TaxID=2713644 RepID=UPI00272CD9AC|nr:hypothetical protein [Methylicorpusculum sp.]
MAMVSGRLAVILNKRAWGSFLRMSAAGMLLSKAPMEGFTEFLKRLFPTQNNAENIKLGIADTGGENLIQLIKNDKKYVTVCFI